MSPCKAREADPVNDIDLLDETTVFKTFPANG
jgi:hypothetical protein